MSSEPSCCITSQRSIAPKNETVNFTARSSDELLARGNRDPIWFCKLLVSRPVSVFAVTLGSHVLLLLLTVLLIVSGYDVLPVDFSGVPLNLEKDPTKLRADAWNFASYGGAVTGNPTNSEQDERGIRYQTIELVYELPSGNILTRENLLLIEKNEKEVFENKKYQEKFCQLVGTSNRTCRPPFSILRLFDGTYKNLHPSFFDPNYQNISLALFTAKMFNLTRSFLSYHLGKDTSFDEDNRLVYTSYCRSLFYIGWPLKGYQNVEQNEEEQVDKLDSYIAETFAGTLEEKGEKGVGSMNFYYDSQALRRHALQKQVVNGMLLALFSFVFILLFMWLQTGSLWITGWAIFSIISSFNITNLIYRIVFDYRYFGVFHVLSIFIILGIGADDVFVFMDTWKQSKKVVFSSLEHRLSFVYRRAAKAMFITSFTTMVAFLSNVPSPLLAISSFGVFSAILIFVNYCSIVIFFPAVVIVHHQCRKGRCCCCLLCRNHAMDSEYEGSESNATSQQQTRRNRKRIGEYVIVFFEGVFFAKIISHKVTRYVVLSCFAALIAVSIVFAVKLKPQEEQVEVWSKNTNWAKVKKLGRTAFSASQEDRVVKVFVIWGLMEQDRSSCHHTDFKCRGRTVFDTSFDMNLSPCQRAAVDFCKTIKNLPPEEVDKLKLRRNQVTGEIETECFAERMQEYFKDESSKGKYPSNSDFSVPFNEDKMKILMQANPLMYNVSKLSENYYRYFEVGLGFFITNGTKTRYANSYDYQTYSKYLGAANDISTSGTNSWTGMKESEYGNRLLFMGFAVNTTLKFVSLGYTTGLPIHDNWENFVLSQMKTMPPSCNKAFQATAEGFNIWHWLKVQQILIKNAIQGIVVGILLALLVLVLATTNIFVGILATFTLSMITCSVLAAITIFGWELGVLESLNMTLVVGLSVDYVVHLAEGYVELEDGDRITRAKHALGHVGISILSGACTTLGASVFMFAAEIVFFLQFGIFIFCTIGFSTLYSLFFFTTVLALVGPEDHKGSILPAVQKAKDFIRGKTKEHEDCRTCNGKGFHLKTK